MQSGLNPALSEMTPFMVMEVLERANAMEKQGIEVIHMEVGEPDFNLPAPVSAAMQEALNLNYSHYTHSLGTRELRNAIAHFHKLEYNVVVDPDCIVVTSGSSPAILMVLMTLCAPGDEVIMSNPGYPCYRNFALACNARIIDVPIDAESGFQYNVELVKKTITPRTKAIFVNSPMNPTGTLAEPEVLKQLVDTGITVISDEIYHGLVYEGKAHSILEYTDKAFVINGFSKRFAMTGLRLGYVIAPQKYMRSLQILQQNLFICAPSLEQHAAIAALDLAGPYVQKMLETYNERRLYLFERLIQMGFEIKTRPQGAFYMYANACRFTCDSYKFAFDVLENAHVGITPGIDFGSNGEGFVRFSYANSLQNIKTGLDRLEKYLS